MTNLRILLAARRAVALASMCSIAGGCSGAANDLASDASGFAGEVAVNFRGASAPSDSSSAADLGVLTPGGVPQDSGAGADVDSQSPETDDATESPNPNRGADVATSDLSSSFPEDSSGGGSVDAFTEPDSAGCTPACNGKNCGPDNCGGVCGVCAASETCDPLGVCVTDGAQTFGGPCHITEDCQPTVVNSFTGSEEENPLWPNCLDAQCDQTGGANYCFAPYQPFCSTACNILNDLVDNSTGQAVPDGIEDPGSGSGSCQGSSDALTSEPWSCVRFTPMTDPAFSACMPGEEFWSCSADQDCPADEVCKYMVIAGTPQFRCSPPLAGTKKSGAKCEANPWDPAVPWYTEESYCESSLCLNGGVGCSKPCADNKDCASTTLGQVCSAGACANNPAVSCTTDTDCSALLCGTINFTSGDALDGCVPRGCNLDAHCVDPGFYCRTGVSTDSEENTATWQHSCVPGPSEFVALGQACNEYPSLGNTENLCVNPDWCIDGYCGRHCQSDGDCAAANNQVCATEEFDVDVNSDESSDVVLALGICRTLPHLGPAVDCARDGDCTPGTQICTPFIQGLPPATPVLVRQCADLNDRAGYAEKCGATAKKGCGTGLCYGFSIMGDEQRVCSATCTSSSDCAAMVVDGVSYPALCGSLRFARNGTLDVLDDDISLPVCIPAEPGSSLKDCSGVSFSEGATADESKCEVGERCSLNAIYTIPGEPATIEMICDEVPASATVSLGANCTTNSACISGLCNAGVCIAPCDPNDFLSCSGSALTCQLASFLDQPGGQNDLLAWMCVP